MQRNDKITMVSIPPISTAVLLINLTASGLSAQVIPTAGDFDRQIQTSSIDNNFASTALPDLQKVVIEPPLTALPGGPTIVVSRIAIVGNRALSLDVLTPVISSAFGTRMTLADLEELALSVTRFYRTKGYFVARAYIPAQEVVDGVVTFRIVEGNYGDFILENSSLVKDKIAQSILDDVKVYDIVSLDTLERAMLIANDTPGVKVVRADVMPGEAIGTSDFIVETVATKKYFGSLELDNFGSVYTGKKRLSFNAGVNSPTGNGDQLSLSGMISETSGISNLRLAYSTLLQPNGLRGEFALAQTTYKLGSTFSDLNAVGSTRSIDASFTYPIKRTRNRSIDVRWGLNSRNLNDEIRSSGDYASKHTNSMDVGLSFRDEGYLWGKFGLTQADASITLGSLNLDEKDADGARAQGDYAKLNMNASRVMKLSNDISATVQLRFQHSIGNKNLDSSERMGVSGSGGVMAYPLGELSGTNAVFARIEFKEPLPTIAELPNFSHDWAVFAEWGRAGEANPVNSSDEMRSISDIGLSWSAKWNKTIAKVYLVHRLEDANPITEPASRTGVVAQVGWVF